MYLDGSGELEPPPDDEALIVLAAATVGSVGTVQKSLPL
jgi:hypothetical protein